MTNYLLEDESVILELWVIRSLMPLKSGARPKAYIIQHGDVSLFPGNEIYNTHRRICEKAPFAPICKKLQKCEKGRMSRVYMLTHSSNHIEDSANCPIDLRSSLLVSLRPCRSVYLQNSRPQSILYYISNSFIEILLPVRVQFTKSAYCVNILLAYYATTL